MCFFPSPLPLLFMMARAGIDTRSIQERRNAAEKAVLPFTIGPETYPFILSKPTDTLPSYFSKFGRLMEMSVIEDILPPYLAG